MTVKEIRNEVKKAIIAQDGKFYNFNFNNLVALGATGTQIQNATNYFRYSPQQAVFREKYNFH